MTNFDPAGFLLLLTVIPAVVAGTVSITVGHVVSRLGVSDYERAVTATVGVLAAAWIVAAVLVSTGMLQILLVGLSMVGAYAVTRSVADTAYAWVLGVVLLFGAFVALSALGIYQGVDQRGRPQGIIAQNLSVFYAVGLFLGGVVAGGIVAGVRRLLAERGRD